MTVVYHYSCKGYHGDATCIKITESNTGQHYHGPGAWLEDRIFLNGKNGKIIAEREIIGKDNEKIIVSIKKQIGDKEARNLIETILEPYRKSYIESDSDNDIQIWDNNGNKHHIKGGNIKKILEDLDIDIDHPFPDGRDFYVDKSSW